MNLREIFVNEMLEHKQNVEQGVTWFEEGRRAGIRYETLKDWTKLTTLYHNPYIPKRWLMLKGESQLNELCHVIQNKKPIQVGLKGMIWYREVVDEFTLKRFGFLCRRIKAVLLQHAAIRVKNRDGRVNRLREKKEKPTLELTIPNISKMNCTSFTDAWRKVVVREGEFERFTLSDSTTNVEFIVKSGTGHYARVIIRRGGNKKSYFFKSFFSMASTITGCKCFEDMLSMKEVIRHARNS